MTTPNTPEQPKREVWEDKAEELLRQVLRDAQCDEDEEDDAVSAIIELQKRILSTQAAELERVKDVLAKAKTFVESDLKDCDAPWFNVRTALESLDALLKVKP